MSVASVSFGSANLQQDWVLVDSNLDSSDRSNDFAIKMRVQVIKGRFLDAGKAVAAAAYACGLGGFLLEHGAAFYAFVQIAPKTPFEQYFYANAIHEIAMGIMNFSVFGISASTIATVVVALIAGVIVTKLGIVIYNRCVDKEWRVDLSFRGAIQNLFWRK